MAQPIGNGYTTDDCALEFGEHGDDHAECATVLWLMIHGDDGWDPRDDIPWGTPDSWIPDNPNSDGFRQADFV